MGFAVFGETQLNATESRKKWCNASLSDVKPIVLARERYSLDEDFRGCNKRDNAERYQW
jgi:hypothetical protein